MVENSTQLGEQITPSTDSRITRIGQFLRRTKLDELPQLFDVLRGKMSLVGPRPEVPEYVDLYPDNVKRVIFSVKPGITDWASIMMMDEGDMLAMATDPKVEYIHNILPQKLSFAVKYVETRTFKQDLIIIITTILKIFKLKRFSKKKT
jgi:lipopolysaccharide/colanic/teichoic acid biosynthesis glycosyltransferase